MDFSKALEVMKEGKRVRRLEWNDERFIMIHNEFIKKEFPIKESGLVKQVYVKGYKKGEKVLRYAQVIVTQ